MTKKEAILDVRQRTEQTNLVWHVIRIRIKRFIEYTYDTVSENHFITHAKAYKSGKFKSVYICEPEVETELDLNSGTHTHSFKIKAGKDNAHLNIPKKIKRLLINQ